MKCYAKNLTPLETILKKGVVSDLGLYFSATTFVQRIGGVAPE
jgi:hypothetical protein